MAVLRPIGIVYACAAALLLPTACESTSEPAAGEDSAASDDGGKDAAGDAGPLAPCICDDAVSPCEPCERGQSRCLSVSEILNCHATDGCYEVEYCGEGNPSGWCEGNQRAGCTHYDPGPYECSSDDDCGECANGGECKSGTDHFDICPFGPDSCEEHSSEWSVCECR